MLLLLVLGRGRGGLRGEVPERYLREGGDVAGALGLREQVSDVRVIGDEAGAEARAFVGAKEAGGVELGDFEFGECCNRVSRAKRRGRQSYRAKRRPS
jgi:hypothetical protein